MIVQYAPREGLTLQEHDDFRKFKLVLKDVAPDVQPVLAGIVFTDLANALVSAELVPELACAPKSEEWRQGYWKMVDQARKFGWIDSSTGAILAHVER